MTQQQYGNYQSPSSRPPDPPYRSVYETTSAPTYGAGQASQPDTSGIDRAGEIPGTSSYAPVGATEAIRSGDTATMPGPVGDSPTYRYADSAPEPRPSAKGAKAGAGKTFAFGFLGALLACVLALGVGGFALGLFNGNPANAAANRANTTPLGTAAPSVINAADEGQTLAEAVAAKALPSVVCIYVYSEPQSYGGYFGFGASDSGSSGGLEQSSLGSGVILTEDGYILTNYHVIEGSSAMKVNISGTEYDAELVGSDPSSDLAVIKAKDVSGLTAADIGDSDNLTVGEWVMTVGSPFGLEQSVATGVVSATSRSRVVESESYDGYFYGYGATTSEPTLYPNMIQTDAAINPGNSGGALVDADGKLIGINTLIASYSGNYSGVGFAIPVNYAINIANQIIEGKTPTHAKLGVSLTNVTSQNAARFNLPVTEGAYVSQVNAGSGADEAGIKVGDIIVAFNGEKVATSTDLTLDIRKNNPGDVVTITVNRGGEQIDLEVTLGSDEQDLAASQMQQENGQYDEGNGNGYGNGNGNGYGYGQGNGGREYSYEDLLHLFGF